MVSSTFFLVAAISFAGIGTLAAIGPGETELHCLGFQAPPAAEIPPELMPHVRGVRETVEVDRDCRPTFHSEMVLHDGTVVHLRTISG